MEEADAGIDGMRLLGKLSCGNLRGKFPVLGTKQQLVLRTLDTWGEGANTGEAGEAFNSFASIEELVQGRSKNGERREKRRGKKSRRRDK